VHHFLTERYTSLVVDRRVSHSRPVQTGIPQGSPISPLLFMLYTAPMCKVIKDNGDKCVLYVEDITIYVHGSVKGNTEKPSKLLAICTELARDHYTDVDLGDKLSFIHLRAPKQEREKAHETPILLPDGGVRTPQEEVKLLGITLESGLNFRSHIKNMTSRAERTLQQMLRLGGGCYHGLSGVSFRMRGKGSDFLKPGIHSFNLLTLKSSGREWFSRQLRSIPLAKTLINTKITAHIKWSFLRACGALRSGLRLPSCHAFA
jgi:hypothetical protein